MGIESATTGYEKRLIVDHAIVATHGATAVQPFDGRGDTDGDTEMAGKPIAAASGHYAEGSVGTYQTASHFVDRAVSAYCNHRLKSELRIVRSQLCGVTCVLGDYNIVCPNRRIYVFLNQIDDFSLADGAGKGVDDEGNISHCFTDFTNNVQRYEK